MLSQINEKLRLHEFFWFGLKSVVLNDDEGNKKSRPNNRTEPQRELDFSRPELKNKQISC